MDNVDNKYNFSILLVEDDIPSKLYVSTVLKHKTDYLYLAENGREGLEQFITHKPDIVITDIGMPFMNGLEMSRIIKTNKPKTQIILTTVFDNNQRLLEAIDIGINQYLTKPVTKERLLRAVDRAVEILSMEREIEENQIALKKANDELEIRVNDRTAELQKTNDALLNEIEIRKKTESELRTAKNNAESANKAKDAFLAKVNHELRTPLNGILGITSILLGTEINEKQRSFLEMVKSSADSLLRIINDILDFSKIEAGRLELQITECNLNKIVIHVVDLLSQQAKNKDLYLKKTYMEGIPSKVLCDERRIQQVLINLVGNAIKFTDKGVIEVIVRKEFETDDAVTVLFAVKDTGIGIPKDKISLLFKSFSQVDDSFTRRHGGTGLGLAISKELVELMDGKIWFDSTYGEGSTFSFLLSFKKGQSYKGEFEASEPRTENIYEVAKHYKDIDINILIVEDSLINQEVLKQAFLQKNWHVYSALTGNDALDIVNNAEIDIILMDIELSDISGIEVTQGIRSNDDKIINSIPIIGLTGHTEPDYLSEAVLSGMNTCITKPFKWTEIFDNIYKYMDIENNIHINKDDILPINKENIDKIDSNTLDINKLLEVLNGNKDLLIHLIAYFKENYPKEIEKIDEAILKNDNVTIQKIAHKLKSEVGNFGSEKAVDLARKIEKRGKENDLKDININIIELKNELTSLVSSLDNYVVEIKSSI